MAHPAYIREKARQLRIEKRLSLIEIVQRLALPKTTVFYWIRDLPNPEIKNGDTPARARARAKAARRNSAIHKARRDAAYQQGRDEYPALVVEPTFIDFVSLYMAEGYKRTRNVVSLANSDPAIIRVADHWIHRLARNPVTYAIQYHADQDSDYLKRFWAFGLGADIGTIRCQRKSNSNQLTGRIWRSRFGVLTVSANDTRLRMRLEAWMHCLKESWLDSISLGV
ncbi:MAG: hypothetical protein ACRDLL_07900 [Solirubrobacterales bacterium]